MKPPVVFAETGGFIIPSCNGTLITAPFTDALHRVGISIALMIANPNPQQLGGCKDPSQLYIA